MDRRMLLKTCRGIINLFLSGNRNYALPNVVIKARQCPLLIKLMHTSGEPL
jgi:hypothetical protein